MVDTGEIWRSVGATWGAEAERAACAALVRAAGCLCAELLFAWKDQPGAFEFSGTCEPPEWEPAKVRKITVHDPRCPEALAEAIEARGKE